MNDAPGNNEPVPVLEALDNMLEELRREFARNPEFAHRVAKSLGASVSFDSGHAAALINPVELVAEKSEEDAVAELAKLRPADLRKIAKDFNLATSVDMKGKSGEAIAALIAGRARIRIAERSPRQEAGPEGPA